MRSNHDVVGMRKMTDSVLCRVTILLCTYNGEASLGAAIESALFQTTEDIPFEVLVVDDGSTDETHAITKGFAEKYERVRILKLEQNQGLPAACNAGIEASRGAFILRLDDDDLLNDCAISALCPYLESGEEDWVISDRLEVDSETGESERITVGPFNLFRLTACGVMMRKDLLMEVGGYRPVFWEEYDLYLRYIEKTGRPPQYIEKPLYTYFRHSESMTGDPGRMGRGWDELVALWGKEKLIQHGWNPGVLT